MAQQPIANLEGGLAVRNAINGNFTELYAAITLPLKLPGINANAIQAIPANTLLWVILIQWVSGAPTVSIGTTGGGTEIMNPTLIVDLAQALPQLPFINAGTVYITITGVGVVNVSMIAIKNIF